MRGVDAVDLNGVMDGKDGYGEDLCVGSPARLPGLLLLYGRL